VLQPIVVVTVVAAGSVDDYNGATRLSLREAVALESDVGVDEVALTIKAASVILRFDITLESEQASTQLTQRLSQTALANASAASYLLGVTVESAPAIETSVRRIVYAHPAAPPPLQGSSDHTLIMYIGIGGGVTILLAILCAGARAARGSTKKRGTGSRAKGCMSRCGQARVCMPNTEESTPGIDNRIVS